MLLRTCVQLFSRCPSNFCRTKSVFFGGKSKCPGFGNFISSCREFRLCGGRVFSPSFRNSVLLANEQQSKSEGKSEQGQSKPSEELVEVNFVTTDGKRLTGKGKIDDSLLDIVVDKNLPLDGFGACEGTLACSTCHVIFKKEDFYNLPDKPSDEELDMLDLAYGLCDTSRLGCQIFLTKDMEGIEVTVPEGTSDARST